MDDIPAWEAPSSSVRWLSVGQRSMLLHPSITLSLDLGATTTDDSRGNTPAVLEIGVGGVDDGIDIFVCQVALDNLEASTAWLLKLAKNDVQKNLSRFVSTPDCTFSKGLRQRKQESGERRKYTLGIERASVIAGYSRYVHSIVWGRCTSVIRTVRLRDDVERVKTDPELFLSVLANTGMEPREVVFEDSSNGIQAAKAARKSRVAARTPVTRQYSLAQADLRRESLQTRPCNFA